MNDFIRIRTEEIEHKILSPKAAFASNTKGRLREEEKCPVRTDFQRDRDRIIHSKSFRRLKHKAQVFISPENDHFRTRLTHSLEVFQVSTTIARALMLNEDLTAAIALGHDLGHAPFGHAGEGALNTILLGYDSSLGFHHAKQSLKVVDILENDGLGLNLTYEVRDGIAKHSKGVSDLASVSDLPVTLEGQIVRISDRVAYLNHDIDDAVRAGFITVNDIPNYISKTLGDTTSKRISSMIMDIIISSEDLDEIRLSDNMKMILDNLKDFMFEKVYFSKEKLEVERKYFDKIKYLFDYYYKNNDADISDREKLIATADYISSMTDNYAESCIKDIKCLN